MKLTRVTLFQCLIKVDKPKSGSNEYIAPIVYYTIKKKFSSHQTKIVCRVTFFFSLFKVVVTYSTLYFFKRIVKKFFENFFENLFPKIKNKKIYYLHINIF